jgi:hypothetical protein
VRQRLWRSVGAACGCWLLAVRAVTGHLNWQTDSETEAHTPFRIRKIFGAGTASAGARARHTRCLTRRMIV